MMICDIKRIITHNNIHKTFIFDAQMLAKPGQFVMVWIPGVDEIPMSLSKIGKEKGITVEKIGDGTDALHRLAEGDKIGIRGAYGNGFKLIGKKALFVAGGTGIASLMPLITEYKGEKHVVLGAKSSKYLLFTNELKIFTQLTVATDDGSSGFKGLVTDVAINKLIEKKYDILYTCGPEIMMKKLLDECLKIKLPMQASLERYMKCGVGICDSCSINGYHVCADGPVFPSHILCKIKDFGKWKRNEAGRRIKI
jgi:dihydroorotate dehydrogenase electron transfer subunit